MTYEKMQIMDEIESLPEGYISNKKINGKLRHYRQWNEDGKLKSKYIPDSEYESVKQGIERRRELQTVLKSAGIEYRTRRSGMDFETAVFTGDDLRSCTAGAAALERRECFANLQKYLEMPFEPRIMAVFGLRRTGKTTLLFQAAAGLDREKFDRAAYIKARKGQNMYMLDRDLKKLKSLGYTYVFIDEITFLDDFIDTASMLSDVYAATGMKIIISGTDSLGIWLAEREELYDRVYTVHTTWIPFREHSRLLGTDDIDDYIRYGGTLRAGETAFGDPALRSEDISFRDDESTRRYIDTAICKNIQHSLSSYENGSRFMHLQELYDAGELTGAINRIIESMNHRFVLKVLTENFRSNDLQLARRNLLRERDEQKRSDALDHIELQSVTERLMEILEIRNRSDRSVKLTDAHVREIREYLKALDLIEASPVVYASGTETPGENILIMQPGMRYCQAQALVWSLTQDSYFSGIPETEKEYVSEKILTEVRGRMLEEIILIETARTAGNGRRAFKYQFPGGEIDMIVYDSRSASCRLYEIKHSTEAVREQCAHLLDEEACRQIEYIYGSIVQKSVIYRGRTFTSADGVEYINASEYLKNLA